MSVLRKLADWLDPVRVEDAAANGERIANARTAIDEMSTKLAEISKANDNLINKLSASGIRIAVLGQMANKLRIELATARAYAIDAVDEIDEQLEALGPRSKKRVALIATRETVAADIESINAALSEASKVL